MYTVYTVVIIMREINLTDIHRYAVCYLQCYWYSDIEFDWKKVLPFRTIICIVETITDEFLIETLKQWKQKNNNIVITTKGNDSIY